MALPPYGGVRELMSQKTKAFWKKILAGFILGVGGILPGVSGGILAVSMGLYRRMLEAVYTFFRAPKENFLYLLPLGVGGVIGLVSVAQVLEWLMGNYRMPVMYLFIGLVLGGVPSLYREGVGQGKFRPRYLAATGIGILFILLLSFIKADGALVSLRLNFATAMLCGGIIAVGVVVPGVSTAFLLMYLGLYDDMLAALNRFDIPILIATGIGVAALALLTIKFVRYAFNKHSRYAYFGVMGFLVASVALIFPGFASGWNLALHLALAIGGFFASYAMEKAMEKG